MAVESNVDSGWANAIAFHELMRQCDDEIEREKVRDSAIRAILAKAQSTLGSISRPYSVEHADWKHYPLDELDIEASLEEDPLLENLLVERRRERRTEIIVCLDTSLSMTGRKLALLGVSVATLALQVPSEDLCIINFESEAHLVKPLGTKATPFEVVKSFLHSPAKGLTNMESALKLAIRQSESGRLAKRTAILMSDGRFTAGARPDYLVPSLPRLHVVQTGNPWSNNRFFKRLAKLGNGRFLRVGEFEDLPKALYALVHESLR